jgi:methylglutaconyl-CoA hydratase
MWVSGITQGLMWRAYDSLGFLQYSFAETVDAMHPYYVIRAVGGLLDAMFGFTEVVLGILPAMISPYVVRKIGLSAARELCLSGVRFSAARAKDIGLVHDVVTSDRLDLTVDRHVAQFLKAAPSAVAATKRLLAEVAGRMPADVLEQTVDAIATQRVSAEGQEGMRAFLEKRPAPWQS